MTAPGPGYPHKRRKSKHPGGGVSKTKQSDTAATDINRIMAKFTQTGMVPAIGDEPKYGDFSTKLDFHTALSQVKQAQSEFMRLPAHVRKYCENDPGVFLDLVMDPDGRKELQELGMVSDFAPPGAPEPSEDQPEVPADTLPPESE